MNFNAAIRGDDSGVDMETRDVDVETITDTLWSVDMPGHRLRNISSSDPLITKPLEKFLNIIPVVFIPTSILRLHRIQKLPSGKSREISISQASNSQTENSAARCHVVLVQEVQQVTVKKLTKARSQPKYTAMHTSVRCDRSAATSATTSSRLTVLARRTYIRKPAVPAIDKEGSYHHYLHRKIKQLISVMASYAQNLDREIRLINFTIDSYFHELDGEITMLKPKVGSNADDLDSKLNLLGSKMELYDGDLDHRRQLLLSKMFSCAHDLNKKITSLNSKIASYAHDLETQITLLNSKTNSYADDLGRKFKMLRSRLISSRAYFLREFEQLKSETV